MTRAQLHGVMRVDLHGVTILADATMAMVAFPQGRPRRYFIRTAEELRIAMDTTRHRVSGDVLVCSAVNDAMRDAWERHLEEAWAALEARTGTV